MASDVGILFGYSTLGGLACLLAPLLFRMLMCCIGCCFGFCLGLPCWGIRLKSHTAESHSLPGDAEAGYRFSHYQSGGTRATPCGIYIGLFLFGAYVTVVLFIMNPLGDANLEPTTVNPIDFTTMESKSTDLGLNSTIYA